MTIETKKRTSFVDGKCEEEAKYTCIDDDGTVVVEADSLDEFTDAVADWLLKGVEPAEEKEECTGECEKCKCCCDEDDTEEDDEDELDFEDEGEALFVVEFPPIKIAKFVRNAALTAGGLLFIGLLKRMIR